MKFTPTHKLGFADKLGTIVNELDSVRCAPTGGLDLSLTDYLTYRGFKNEQGNPITFDELCHDMGVELNRMTIENLLAAPYDTKWLVPEIIREAIRLGLRRAPIHPNIIRSHETVAQPSVILPRLEFSGDTKMDSTAEAETIGVGYVAYGQKTVGLHKKAKGIDITYEAIRYTIMNLVSIFFEDVGIRLGHSLDALAISTILNGDQSGGSESAPVIGVASTSDKLKYKDLLKTWIRGGLIGRNWSTMIGNEDMILSVMSLSEYATKTFGDTKPLTVKVPIVQSPTIYAHNNVTGGYLIMQDNSYGLVQLTSAPLMVESDKIIRRQLNETVASITTGFSKLFRDSSVVINEGTAFSGAGFPSWMFVGWSD